MSYNNLVILQLLLSQTPSFAASATGQICYFHRTSLVILCLEFRHHGTRFVIMLLAEESVLVRWPVDGRKTQCHRDLSWRHPCSGARVLQLRVLHFTVFGPGCRLSTPPC